MYILGDDSELKLPLFDNVGTVGTAHCEGYLSTAAGSGKNDSLAAVAGVRGLTLTTWMFFLSTARCSGV